MKKLVLARRISQGLFLLLFIYILWSSTYPLKGLLPPETFFRINPLIVFVASVSLRVVLPGLILCVLMLILTLIFGRFFCGWICPLGSTIDIAGALRRKSPNLTDKLNAKLGKGKFVIMVIIFIFAYFGIQIAWIFDPMVIMARFVSLNLIPSVTLSLDKAFSAVIRGFKLYGPLYDFYRALKTSVLGVRVAYFSHSLVIFLFFALIISASGLLKRFWCRLICPLGAIYALAARFSLLKRIISPCVNCKRCKSLCRMGAIHDDLSYAKGECVLCMDCIYDCPAHATVFAFAKKAMVEPGAKNEGAKDGISRKNFLVWLVISVISFLGFRNRLEGPAAPRANIIRPPGVENEDEFLDRCIRCGNCMKVCITNGLQPLLLQQGLSGIWTPHLIPEIGYCEYNCTLCGNVCPTQAIPRLSLEQKRQARLGLARIDHALCLPWSKSKDCIVCEEHCPISDKAIKLKEENIQGRIIKKPFVDPALCIGCGICQNKCPVRPERAIKVERT